MKFKSPSLLVKSWWNPTSAPEKRHSWPCCLAPISIVQGSAGRPQTASKHLERKSEWLVVLTMVNSD